MDLLNCVKSKEHKQDRISLKEYLFFKVCFSYFLFCFSNGPFRSDVIRLMGNEIGVGGVD